MENNTPFKAGDTVGHKDYPKEKMDVMRIVGESVVCQFKNSKGDWVEKDFHYKNLVLIRRLD